MRAGWSLGAVTSRYIFAEEGGDQLLWRAACGPANKYLDVNAPRLHPALKNMLIGDGPAGQSATIATPFLNE